VNLYLKKTITIKKIIAMKRKIFLFTGAVTLLFALNSCKNNLDLDKELKFSTQTVEQQKATLEQNGIDFINKVDALQDTKAMIALQAFSSYAGSPNLVKSLVQLRTNVLKNNVTALDKFNGQMKALATSTAVEDDVWGTYTWNFTEENFDFTASSSKVIIMKFPGTEGSNTNNGELKITYVESSVVAPDSDPVQYMPKECTLVLKVNNSVAMEAKFTGTYYADATPKSVTQTLEIDKYNWKLQYKNDEEDASAKYAFNYGSDVLLKFEVAAAGTLTATAIEDMANGGSEANDIFSSGAVYFQVMNVAMLGGFKDFNAFYNEMDALNYSDTKSYYDDQADVFNKYLIMYGYFVKENKKFADVEFYAAEIQVPDYSSQSTLVYTSTNYVTSPVEYDYYNYEYNQTSGYYVYNYYAYGTKTGYELQPRMVLSDGSKVAVEDFLASGFEDLINKVQSYQQ